MLPLSIEKLSPKGRHPKNCIRKHPTRFITVKPKTMYQLDKTRQKMIVHQHRKSDDIVATYPSR